MARRAEGWELVRDKRNGIWGVRFRVGTRRRLLSTRTTNRREALVRAAEIYAEALAGKLKAERPRSRESLGQLLSDWIDAREGTDISEATANEHERYASTLIGPFFGALDKITEASAEDYARSRLSRVTRSTVLKELSALRMFLKWCKTRGHIAAAPEIPNPPPKATGTSSSPKTRVDLTFEQVEAFVGALPSRTKRGKHPAQAFARVMWETGLRYGTITKLRAPDDYRVGEPHLVIRPEIDKARFGRRVPLSQAARDALDGVCPEDGLIFGPMDLRATFRAAAKASGLSDFEAEHLSHHDLRHARLTYWGGKSADLRGLAHLGGHKHVTTTALYVHSGETAAGEVLDAAIGIRNRDTKTKSGRKARRRK